MVLQVGVEWAADLNVEPYVVADICQMVSRCLLRITRRLCENGSNDCYVDNVSGHRWSTDCVEYVESVLCGDAGANNSFHAKRKEPMHFYMKPDGLPGGENIIDGFEQMGADISNEPCEISLKDIGKLTLSNITVNHSDHDFNSSSSTTSKEKSGNLAREAIGQAEEMYKSESCNISAASEKAVEFDGLACMCGKVRYNGELEFVDILKEKSLPDFLKSCKDSSEVDVDNTAERCEFDTNLDNVKLLDSFHSCLHALQVSLDMAGIIVTIYNCIEVKW